MKKILAFCIIFFIILSFANAKEKTSLPTDNPSRINDTRFIIKNSSGKGNFQERIDQIKAIMLAEEQVSIPKHLSAKAETNNNTKRIIVTLKDPSTIRALSKIDSSLDLKEARNFRSEIREQVIRKLDRGIVKNRYLFFNGFSAEVTDEELSRLLSNNLVERVETDEAVHISLMDSVPLIRANDTWALKTNGINLTGKGETVCIIDTGIDYAHPDLGNCSISSVTTSTPEPYGPINLSNYTINYDQNWTITKSGYGAISIHFSEINLESESDFLYILDSDNNLIEYFYGNETDTWTPAINGDTIKIRLITDNITDYEPRGFNIDATKNVIPASANWSSCSKVIGGTDITNDDSDPMDDHGHGTHVAGIIAANGEIKGVAPDANLLAVKALDSSGSGWDSEVIAGIDYCTSNKDIYNISVISMSLGGLSYDSYCDSSEPTIASAINSAVSKGISVVVASGNDGSSTRFSSPSCIQNSIAVTATTKSDEIAGYANRNSLVDIAAPGNLIYSTWNDGGYRFDSGTSMAAPHVSGAVAILNQYFKSQNLTKTPLEIKNILASTGKMISDEGYSDRNYSRIDIFSALLSQDSAPPITNISKVNVWKNATFNITLSASDNLGVWYTTYLFNGSEYNGTTIEITQDGNYTIGYYSVDKAGNREETRTAFGLLDTQPPLIYSVNISRQIVKNGSSALVTVNASDSNSLVSVTAEGIPLLLIDGVWTGNITLISPPLDIVATDVAGNFVINDSLSYEIDDISPSINSVIFSNRIMSSANLSVNINATDNFNISLVAINGQELIQSTGLWIGNVTLDSSPFNIIVADFAGNILTNTYYPPVIEDISDITLNETGLVNLTLYATDPNNDSLSYSINNNKFTESENSLWWQTTTNDGGEYDLSVIVSDGIFNVSKNFTLTILDVKDSDNDGIPDNVDPDNDNDGVNDTIDRLTGNSSNINSTTINITLKIDNETLNNTYDGERNITVYDGANPIIEFEYNFTNNTLSLEGITIEKQTNNSHGILTIRGLLLPDNQTKTVYVDNLENNTNSVCVKDSENTTISDLCILGDEYPLNCPGENQNYNCTLTNNNLTFKVSGLHHSSVSQQTYCGDGAINPGEECESGNFNGETCITKGFDKGTLSCTSCQISTSSCSMSPADGSGGGARNCGISGTSAITKIKNDTPEIDNISSIPQDVIKENENESRVLSNENELEKGINSPRNLADLDINQEKTDLIANPISILIFTLILIAGLLLISRFHKPVDKQDKKSVLEEKPFDSAIKQAIPENTANNIITTINSPEQKVVSPLPIATVTKEKIYPSKKPASISATKKTIAKKKISILKYKKRKKGMKEKK